MFPATTTVTFYESKGNKNTFVTIVIDGVTQTTALHVHSVSAFFILVRDSVGGGIKFVSIRSTIPQAEFIWSGTTVFAGFLIDNAVLEQLYTEAVRIALRFGVTAVPRIAV